jgi:hypothetical protein
MSGIIEGFNSDVNLYDDNCSKLKASETTFSAWEKRREEKKDEKERWKEEK